MRFQLSIAGMGKTVLITGATSGIGLELARLFARDGHRLILVARNKEKLEKVQRHLQHAHDSDVYTIIADLTNKDAPQTIFNATKALQVPIDVLVNNAGVGVYGDFKDTPLQQELEMIQVNIVALTALTKLFLPEMITRNNGNILNIASTAAFQPGPAMSVYFATKAYVLSFSEAIREELRDTGVSVTTFCPGPTRTNFDINAGASRSKIFTNPGLPDAGTVARIGYDALQKKKMTVVFGWNNKLLMFLVRLTPRFLVTRVVRYLQVQKIS